MSENNRLTDAEHEVLAKLAEAHNLFVNLPKQHPGHIEEWVHHLHDLQRLIMSRPTARAEGWVKLPKEHPTKPKPETSYGRRGWLS